MGYVVVAILGAVFGVSELLSRYRDEPSRALRSWPALLYLGINAAIAVGTLYLAQVFDWRFGMSSSASEDTSRLQAMRVLICGFGAMATLRSSLFNIRINGHEVGIGLSAIVQVFLRAADAAVDRHRGSSRDAALRLMDNVAFDKAAGPLPAYCLALMQNLPKADQDALGREVDEIRKMKAGSTPKSRLLGLAIMNFLGEAVLVTAVESLGEQIALEKTQTETHKTTS